ncbi:MAG: DNA mismatch repair protein MutS domain [Prolixibacteraceae bacterium]|nr:MAG: DNA mismatch repair protein MutS domain [Prolixibacteraceae bacterium]
MNAAVETFYSQKAGEYDVQIKAISVKLRRFAWYRFFTFLAIFAPLFIFGFKSWFTLFFSLAAIILFLFLIKKNIELEKSKKKIQVLKKLVDDELLALNHQFLHFKNGSGFLNTAHFFSYDLDLFGEGSLFQFINRTATVSGEHKLAGWLIKPAIRKDEIAGKQEAVRELSQIPEWRLNFLAEGQMFEETSQVHDEILSWAGLELKLKNAAVIKWLLKVIPLLTLISIIPAATGITNLFLWFMILAQWILLYYFRKNITRYFSFFGQKSGLLAKYMQLLQFIEEKEFQSNLLCELQNKVKKPVSVSKIFHQLKNLVEQFEYRQNILVGVALNSVLLWDIRCVYRLWNWHNQHRQKLANWLEVIAETDALISLANFTNNHPDFNFPEIQEGVFTFQAVKMGHPLLHKNKRVCNDFEINGCAKVMIITGANMAGKSTFLRTVGVNLILARTGAPVCAENMVFTPIEIYTNMRTTDSLLKDESYFFAELKRIKGVLDWLRKGERIFVILDEMLKGTNSVDKLNGSKELIRKLVELKSVSLVATHDLKLSEMEDEFPQHVFNKCFEIRIENEDLVFDYKLSDGVTKTMNATFLMKKMGII